MSQQCGSAKRGAAGGRRQGKCGHQWYCGGRRFGIGTFLNDQKRETKETVSISKVRRGKKRKVVKYVVDK